MEYNPITVTDLNRYIKTKIDGDEYLNNILVKGEISNFKHHYTGHMYFTLKDENSLVKCIMFKSYTQNLDFVPKDGMKVMLLGSVSVFERDGAYQIYAKALKQEGIGDLYKAYEKLKLKLENEGLFDAKYKKKIPVMPRCIGILTSNTGSVIKDIINVSTRRNPNVYLKLLPVPVQGQGAAEKIAKGIETFNKQKLADVIILARGGGSLEDLWSFNEEIVARAIFESEIPIISGVGHETDFTISDFVSDLRAPTPSAAAELAVADTLELKRKLDTYKNRYKLALKKKTEVMRLRYEKCMSLRVLKEPMQNINEKYMLIDIHVKNIKNSITNKLKQEKSKEMEIISRLDGLSPLKTLLRGYSITQKDNKIIKSAKDLNSGDEITIKFLDGNTNAKII